MKKIITVLLIIILVLGVVLISVLGMKTKEPKKLNTVKIDDWELNLSSGTGYEGVYNAYPKSLVPQTFSSGAVMESGDVSNDYMGFSVGGAKDANNFRENIKNGYFPLTTDITYNGLFYDYSFDTERKENTSKDLFSPSYIQAFSQDPFSGEKEYYMAVGLNSNIKESDFKRKKLNLVVVLDISGSMSSSFNEYYYDGNIEKNLGKKSKMQIANEAVNTLIDQLNDDDRFGLVLFESQAYTAKPLNLIGETDIEKTKEHILQITDKGGTNFEAGYKNANELLKEYANVNNDEYENRIIVVTDAMPNTGNVSDESLMSMVKKNAENKIYTSFIGVGVDFNTQLIETISNVKGANYYSVHNAEEFQARMGEQFEYMVTPLVFDLEFKLKSTDYEIVNVYGSDTVNKATGSIMNINTLFPSKSNSKGEVKGGIVLLKLKNKTGNNNGKIELVVEYKDRTGEQHNSTETVEVNSSPNEYYENNGIRKAIVLSRYASVLKDWIMYERTENRQYICYNGIIEPQDEKDYTGILVQLGIHERQSEQLKVSKEYKEIFSKMKNYIEKENLEVKDETLKQEIDILNILINK